MFWLVFRELPFKAAFVKANRRHNGLLKDRLDVALFLCLPGFIMSGTSGSTQSAACPCTTEARSSCRPAWTEMATPSGTNSFYAVASIASDDIWAIGSRYDGMDDRPMAQHFDGRKWILVSVPSPGQGAAYLRAVAGLSGNDIWAGGYQTTQSGTQITLFEHYDGTSWTIVPSPNPRSLAAYVSALAAMAPDDVWAAGYYLSNTGVYRTLLEHWDGSAWSVVTSPNTGAGDNALNGIATSGGNNVWAVGYAAPSVGASVATLVLHYDGANWSIIPSPNPGGLTSSLSSDVAMADGTIWAGGFYFDGTRGRTLLLHGDVSGFSVFPGEDFANEGNVLNGIAASASGDIWAVGYHYPSGTTDYQGLVEHFDGQQWQVVSTPQGGSYTYLAGIAALPGGFGCAVGNTLTSTFAQSICEIQVGDTGFVPNSAPAAQGDTVGWTFTGNNFHQLTDSTGMGLFDSDARPPGASFQFNFSAAGTYSVSDGLTNKRGSIAVSIILPAKARTAVAFRVTWSAAPPLSGFVFDTQIRNPSDSSFHDWLVGQTNTSANYVAAVAGTYAFRSRLRNTTTDASSNWSPAGQILVQDH